MAPFNQESRDIFFATIPSTLLIFSDIFKAIIVCLFKLKKRSLNDVTSSLDVDSNFFS